MRVSEKLHRASRAGRKQAPKDFDRPLFAVRPARKHVVENQIGRERHLRNRLQEIARQKQPAQARMLFRLPLAALQNPCRAAVPKVEKLVVMPEREPQRIEIVFEADDLQRTHRTDAACSS